MTDIEFSRIYLDIYRDLCFLALRYVHLPSVSEDIVQDAFLRVLVKRPDIFQMEDKSQIKAYMWRSVRNSAIDWCRKNNKSNVSLEERLLDAEISVLIDSMFSPENYGDFDCNIVSEALNDVITALPSRAKEVFTLRRENGLSNKEVADRLGVSVKAVEKQMTIALKRIKQALVHKGIPFMFLLLQFILH